MSVDYLGNPVVLITQGQLKVDPRIPEATLIIQDPTPIKYFQTNVFIYETREMAE